MKRALLFAVLVCSAMWAQVSAPTLRNIYTNVPFDTTGGTATTGASGSMQRPAALFTVQATLVGGTSATGQVEGSNDGTHWFTLQTSPYSLTTGTSAGLVFQAPWYYIRFNCLTNVGGGKVVVLVAW